MKLRSILLAGTVLPLAFSAYAPAFSQAAPLVQVAQADTCAAGDDGCQSKQDKKKKRQERRAQQDQDQGNQPAAAAGAAGGNADQNGGGDKKKRRDAAQQQQSDTPAAAAPAAAAPAAAAPAAAAPADNADQSGGGDARKKRRDAAQQQSDTPTAADAAPANSGQNDNADRKKKRDQQRAQQASQPDTKAENAADQVADPGQDEQQSRDDRKKKRDERRKQRETQTQNEPAAKANPNASVTEQQLESQGSDKQAQKIRDLRVKLREARRQNAQGEEVVEQQGDRQIVRRGNQIYIQPSDNGESDRLLYGASDVRVEQLPNGFTQTTVFRDNGSRIVTIRDPNGDIVNRVRRARGGQDYVLIENRYGNQPPPPVIFEQQLPPVVVQIPQDQYIVDTRDASQDDLETALSAPPVERVERAYTLDEIRRSERLRDKVRRVDLDTITFETGSAVVSSDQLDSLDQVGTAIEEVVAKNPDTVFLIEGHTDAVGSDTDNLVLSDKRAESVAVALSQDYNIPPENLITQGYGEQYLKVPVQGDERENRRVTIRNISPLLSASAN